MRSNDVNNAHIRRNADMNADMTQRPNADMEKRRYADEKKLLPQISRVSPSSGCGLSVHIGYPVFTTDSESEYDDLLSDPDADDLGGSWADEQ